MRFSSLLKILTCSLKRKGISGLRNLILAYLNLKIEPLRMSSEPLIVQIEPTIHCNLKCYMCINPLTEREKRNMRLNEFRKILEDMPFVRKISLVGAGEPLLNPDLFDMISYANAKGILIGFATNGMLLNTENCQKIINSRTSWVNISIDSADKEKFEDIRKGANFDLILDGIKLLLKIKGKRRLPDISLWFVLMNDNLTEIPKVIWLAKNLEIRKVFVQLGHHWNNAQLKGHIAKRNSEDFFQRVASTLKCAEITAKKTGVYFDYVNVPDKAGKRACKWPWKSCYITTEGFITPCCLQGSNPDILNFGNILNDNFRDIWNNISYQKFREVLKSDIAPKICIGCSSYYKKVKI